MEIIINAVEVIAEDGFKTPIKVGDWFLYTEEILCEVTSIDIERDGVIVDVSIQGKDGKYHTNGNELYIKFSDYDYEALGSFV